ncbi:hypothetical protein ACHAWT_009192 [Skeletonema menzelii]
MILRHSIVVVSFLLLLSPCQAFFHAAVAPTSRPQRQFAALTIDDDVTLINNTVENSRRSFLKYGVTTSSAAVAFLSNVLLSPSVAHAEEASAVAEFSTVNEEDKNAAVESIRSSPEEAVEKQPISDEKKAAEEENAVVETIISEEQKLDSDILKEEADEKQTISDEKKLVEELEKKVAIEQDESATPEDIEKEEAKVKEATNKLIEEEEKLKSETEAVITEIEKIESEVKQLEETDTSSKEGDMQKPSDEFVTKLKEKVAYEDDLITRLKKQSEKDIDPKTGKFKAMSARDYKEIAKSTDVDWIKALKDTIANEEEFERDLEAFEGLLDKEFGPAVKAARKDLAPLVGEVVGEVKEEVAKDIAPMVGDVIQQLKEKAGPAVENEVDELKHLAEGAIGKLRSIF